MAERSDRRDSTSSAISITSLPQLPSLRIPNPNIFSDDYALDPLGDSASSSPVSPTPINTRTAAENVFSTPRASVDDDRSMENTPSIHDRPSSTLKRPRETSNVIPHRVVSTISRSESGINRTSSTSSRFSMPRAQSPYVGATGPSHPYAMYPQVTRASSVASESTLRPDTGFIVPTVPEHPYAMYPQNTVPEEEDVPPVSTLIPLGFPGMGQAYQHRTRTAGNDIADIVGADGHIEELPPYTRYPDAGVAKESLAHIEIPVTGQGADRSDIPMSPQSTMERFSDNDVALNTAASRSAGSQSEKSLKDRWRETGRRRVLCGLPCWVLLVMIAAMILVGAIGGVIGGVVGTNKQSSTQASAAADRGSPSAAATVTVTSWIDGSPLPSGMSMPNVPTGQYNIPTSPISLNSNSCIVQTEYSAAWGCMPPGGVGVNVTQTGPSYQVTFDSCPITANFTYGPQPPNLNHPYDLKPSTDKEATDLGNTLFFYTFYDKLTILPENAIGTENPSSFPPGQMAQPGDQPWFCWFNNTVLEFFIYPNHSTTTSVMTTAVGSSMPTATSVANDGLASTRFSTSTYPGAVHSVLPPWQSSVPRGRKNRRHYGYGEENERVSYEDYPRFTKMEDKRHPNPNIAPYCQQMDILYDGQIVPSSSGAMLYFDEVEPAPSTNSKRGSNDGSMSSLNTECACVWLWEG